MNRPSVASVEKTLKVLFLITHIGEGGDWSVVKTIAKILPAERTEAWLNGLRWTDPGSTDFGAEPPIRVIDGWRCLRRTPSLARSLPKDLAIIHAHSPFAILVALFLRFFGGSRAKIVFTFHWPTKDSALRARVKRFLFARADVIQTVSIRTRDQLVKVYGVPARKCPLIYLGVSAARFRPKAPEEIAATRGLLGLPPDAFVIGFLGRFDTEKNVPWIMRFVRENRARYPHLCALIVGGGPLRDRFETDAADLKREGRVVLKGRVGDPESHYPVMDLHVLPSGFEAFALTVAEAAFCGVPTLRTNVEGAIDQIEDGADGFLCDIDGGYPAFAEKLTYVLEERTKDLPKLGERSRARLLNLCDLENFGEQMDSLYRTVSAESPHKS